MNNIPVFVINLDRRPDRMLEMGKRLEGVAFSRISAVDGQKLQLTEEQKSRYSFLTVNEFACIQSHLHVLKKVAEEEIPYACVLEDDVFLGEDFRPFMANADWIPPHAGLIKIETMQTKVWIDRSHLAARNRRLSRLRSNHSGTAGYVVSRAFADRLIAMLEDPTAAADDIMFRIVETDDSYRVLQLHPALCVQEFVLSGETSGSDIAIQREALRNILARPKLTKTQKILKEITRPFLQLAGTKRKITQQRAPIPFQ